MTDILTEPAGLAATGIDGLAKGHLHDAISGTAELIAEAQAGRMFILVDDEDRENEGDLVIPAQFATPQALAFMMRYARGLICLSLDPQQIDRLGLPMMAMANQQRHQTAFTVSVDAREGISTGVSARDRAHTIAIAINPASRRKDLVTPGHVFPLAARPGGTLVRAGHTEAAVDIARMAGLLPAGVICEIMNQDGSMARLPDLVAFAQLHGLKLGTIADLIGQRRAREKFVHRVHETVSEQLDTGQWRVIVYVNTLTQAEHLAMVKGDISGPSPVLARMQAIDPIQMLPGGRMSRLMHSAMKAIEAEGRGVMVVLHDWKSTGLVESVTGRRGPGTRHDAMLREYGIGAQILADLGVHEMVLLSNTARTIVALEGYGLNIVGHRGIEDHA
jgi:3,4-dihydroxy 2-butanone 4-phosphate synthase/GTP cyclohydrolase II